MVLLVGMLVAGIALVGIPAASLAHRRATDVRLLAAIAIVAGFVLALIAFDGLLRGNFH